VSTLPSARLAALHVYPLKSAGGIALTEARVDPTGLAHDRRWLIVDGNGRFVTQRSHTRMALLRTALEDGSLRVTAPGMAPLELPLAASEGPTQEVPVWDLGRFARSCGPEADAWATEWLDEPCRVVRAAVPPNERPLDERGKVRTGFADAYPALVISTASLADLNGRLFEPLPMNRFRPNLVVEGVPAYAEDSWRRVRIGEVAVLGRKTCLRCAITATDQETGERGVEPLRTLATYRRVPEGEVAFGMNLGFESSGTLRVGDPVRVSEGAA
jgi:uncharacterized protein YcbX